MAADKMRVKTNDDDILEVDLDVAKQWAPIKEMYNVFSTVNTDDKPVELSNVDTETLKKVIEWVEHYRKKTNSATGDDDDEPKTKKYIEITDWDKKYFEVKQEMLFGLIMAANYLGVSDLLDTACKTVANMIKDKTPEEVRRTFNIPNDLPQDD